MAKDRPMLIAKEIVNNPKILSEYDGQFVIIGDHSHADWLFDNLNSAICIMAENGWKAISIMGATMQDDSCMYALMERISSGS